MTRSTLALAAAVAIAAPASAQQTLDSFSYKGSHNSYERGLHNSGVPYVGGRVPLNELVLAYNSFSIELDLCLKDDGVLLVKHDCTFLTAEFSLPALLNELFSDPRIFDRFTWLDLELSFNDCCDNWPASCADRSQLIRDIFAPYFPASMVYTPNDFVADGSVWPNMAEMKERGKAFFITWNRDCASDFVFRPDSGDYANPPANEVNYSFEDTDSENVPANIANVAGDRYLLTSYATVYWDNISDSGWFESLGIGSNYLKTNNFSADWTDGVFVHHSYPLYIDQAYAGSESWGTPYAPFKSLAEGMQRMLLTVPRASYDTPVKMRPGVYFTGNGGTLDLPMTIEARGGGPVVILP
jgi:hypothetical protein